MNFSSITGETTGRAACSFNQNSVCKINHERIPSFRSEVTCFRYDVTRYRVFGFEKKKQGKRKIPEETGKFVLRQRVNPLKGEQQVGWCIPDRAHE